MMYTHFCRRALNLLWVGMPISLRAWKVIALTASRKFEELTIVCVRVCTFEIQHQICFATSKFEKFLRLRQLLIKGRREKK